ncbi:hypothetical protein E3P84_03084 [Wallemia ichthyophaga]|nr:hypothetical protein E3P84_03084 [Wallemia ichthyophaga]TIB40261.1 hypothetical protein E3P83_03027 [Wallemia ichthyophaga]
MKNLENSVDISQPKFDQSTYMGRVRHFIAAVSPLTLFASADRLQDAHKDVLAVQERVQKSPGGVFVKPEDAQKYWKNKQLVDSSIHPDTGEPIVLPFRMSAFMPTNLIIIGGMLAPNPSLGSVIFWQWMNQSLNVCVNSANANKSTPLSTKELAMSYLAATASSVGIAVTLTKGVPKLNVSAATKASLGRMVPFVSVVTAGCVNIAAMRYKEMRDGIAVTTSEVDGEPLPDNQKTTLDASSRIAGAVAVSQTAASRVFTNIPTLIFVPLIQAALTKRGAFAGKRGPLLERIVSLGLAGTSMIVFLPPAIAVFPQKATLEINLLSLTVIIEMEFVSRWWSESGESGENGSNGDYTKPPKYNASMDTPRDLPSVGTDESDKEKEKEKQANYSPYTPYTLAWVIIKKYKWLHLIEDMAAQIQAQIPLSTSTCADE